MPSLWLHQNMRVFGGRNAARNTFYRAALMTAATHFPANPAVGGFTELVNNQSAAEALGELVSEVNLGWLGAVACGQTALANGPEFIGLATHRSFTVERIGRISFSRNGQALVVIPEIHDDLGSWVTTIPDGATADYRGVVYLTGQLNGHRCAVGFLHNRYTDAAIRSLVLEEVPTMLATMRRDGGLSAGDPVYLGGDFNVAPRDRGTERTGIAYAYAIGLDPRKVPPGVEPGGTTVAGNLYDYWYSSVPASATPPAGFVRPTAGVDGVTMGDDGSDHALVTLSVE